MYQSQYSSEWYQSFSLAAWCMRTRIRRIELRGNSLVSLTSSNHFAGAAEYSTMSATSKRAYMSPTSSKPATTSVGLDSFGRLTTSASRFFSNGTDDESLLPPSTHFLILSEPP